jgi:hypothetical protein
MTGSLQESQYRRMYSLKSATCSPGGSFVSRRERERRFVRHRDAAGSVGEVQVPVGRDRPDNTRWEIVFSIGPDLLAVEGDFVLVGLSWLKVCDPYQGVVVALDLEGACRVGENLDLAGGVGLHPDSRVALACIA